MGHREADIELGLSPAATRPLEPLPRCSRGLPVKAPSPSRPANQTAWAAASFPAPGPSSDGAPSNASDPAEAAIDALFSDTSVYSAGNATVLPPLMLFPRMPRSAFPPALGGGHRALFEVLVDQQGAVEAVRMRGREQHGQSYYQVRMMLSAAKAWRFRPAQLEGRPVRYVVRVVPQA